MKKTECPELPLKNSGCTNKAAVPGFELFQQDTAHLFSSPAERDQHKESHSGKKVTRSVLRDALITFFMTS